MPTPPQPAPSVKPGTPTISAALAVGFGAAVATWVLAWVLHLPALDTPPTIALPILLLVQLVTTTMMLRSLAQGERLKAGLLAGLVTGLVNLMIVGSVAVKQPESTDSMAEFANRFRSEAWIIIPATIILAVLAGGLGALLARGGRGQGATARGWLFRLAVVTVFVYLPLVAIGGLVTGTRSGLAVPDPVTSYGAISVLFPFELMSDPRIFLEHSHRLFGTLAGLITLVLMVRVLTCETPRLPKVLAVLLFIAVCLQGYAGAVRVSQISTPVAILHGVFGQLVFALSGVLAASLSPFWRETGKDEARRTPAPRWTALCWITLGAVILQLGLGATARHLGHMAPPHNGASHARLTHAAFAFVVVALVIVVGVLAIRAGKAGPGLRPLRALGIGLHGVVMLQFVLGWAALGLVMMQGPGGGIPTADQLASAPPIRPAEALVTTLHQTTGAALLLLTAVTAACMSAVARRSAVR